MNWCVGLLVYWCVGVYTHTPSTQFNMGQQLKGQKDNKRNDRVHSAAAKGPQHVACGVANKTEHWQSFTTYFQDFP